MVEKTSPTPYLRFGGNVDARLQDLYATELLCDDCERRFSEWETKFANEIFYPSANGVTSFRCGPLAGQIRSITRECRHIHRHSRESGNPKAIGSKCVFASYRIPGSRFRGDDGNRRLETDILKLTTLPKLKPRWDVHLSGDDDQLGYAGESLSSILGE